MTIYINTLEYLFYFPFLFLIAFIKYLLLVLCPDSLSLNPWVCAEALVMISSKLCTCLYQATNLQTDCLKKYQVLTVTERRFLLFFPLVN